MAATPNSAPIASDGLLRVLGPIQSLAIVIGTLIGTGIFVVSREMMLDAHTVGWLMLAWTVGGALSLAGALVYAELGTLRPAAGGEYVYLRDGLGPGYGFLFGWGMFWLIRPASIATIGAGFARAADFVWPNLARPAWAGITGEQFLAAALIAVVSGVNYFGVRQGGRVQTVFTAIKVLLVLGLVVAAAGFGHGQAAHFAAKIPGSITVSSFAAALVAALWAYDGWNDLTMAGSEIRDPIRNIPRAMIIGIPAVFVLYVAINLGYVYVLGPGTVARVENAGAALAAAVLGSRGGLLVGIGILVSIFATLNSSILSGARVPFAMARDRWLFPALASVHPRYRTPHVSLMVQAAFAIGLALTGTFTRLYTLTIFAEWLFYALATVALLQLRRRGERGGYRSWRYPLLPVVFLVLATALVAMTFSQNLRDSALGLAVILTGLPVYAWMNGRRQAARS